MHGTNTYDYKRELYNDSVSGSRRQPTQPWRRLRVTKMSSKMCDRQQAEVEWGRREEGSPRPLRAGLIWRREIVSSSSQRWQRVSGPRVKSG